MGNSYCNNVAPFTVDQAPFVNVAPVEVVEVVVVLVDVVVVVGGTTTNSSCLYAKGVNILSFKFIYFEQKGGSRADGWVEGWQREE